MKTELILKALPMAMGSQSIPPGQLTIHSDRGTQYPSEEFRETMKLYGIKTSMSRRGNCWNHSAAETLFASLEKEEVYRQKYATHEEARAAIFNYMETWYNLRRLHSSIGYEAPFEYESELFEVKRSSLLQDNSTL